MYPCSTQAKHCPLAKWIAGPLGRHRRDHLFGSFSGCGCIICHDAICLRPAKPPMRQEFGGGGVDERWLQDSASFASLTNWGKSWRAEAMRTMTKSKDGGRRKGHSGVAGSPEDTV